MVDHRERDGGQGVFAGPRGQQNLIAGAQAA
jgi:hypothetical protein